MMVMRREKLAIASNLTQPIKIIILMTMTTVTKEIMLEG